jgi:hypothetical protein
VGDLMNRVLAVWPASFRSSWKDEVIKDRDGNVKADIKQGDYILSWVDGVEIIQDPLLLLLRLRQLKADGVNVTDNTLAEANYLLNWVSLDFCADDKECWYEVRSVDKKTEKFTNSFLARSRYKKLMSMGYVGEESLHSEIDTIRWTRWLNEREE